jgi:hypothetical protein
MHASISTMRAQDDLPSANDNCLYHFTATISASCSLNKRRFFAPWHKLIEALFFYLDYESPFFKINAAKMFKVERSSHDNINDRRVLNPKGQYTEHIMRTLPQSNRSALPALRLPDQRDCAADASLRHWTHLRCCQRRIIWNRCSYSLDRVGIGCRI